MIKDKDIVLIGKYLINKKFKGIEATSDGFVIVFEDDLVIKVEDYATDPCLEVYAAHRIPSYSYESIQ